MLETNEVDEDYFTPTSSTSLANIFEGPSTTSTASSTTNPPQQNESLKYSPPRQNAPQVVPQSSDQRVVEEPKPECYTVCALMAYEWENSIYVSRGKVGFAIVKVIKSNTNNILIYNSDKSTLSNTTVTPALKVSIKGKEYISFYDNNRKYWSCFGKEEEITKITETLKSLGADIQRTEANKEDCLSAIQAVQPERLDIKTASDGKESDADSSVNRRAGILNRVANIGQSVLPTSSVTATVLMSSDSTDSELTNQPPKRPKPIKPKRNHGERKQSEELVDISKMSIAKVDAPASYPISTSGMFTIVNGQLLPVSNTNIVSTSSPSCSNEMSLFMTEQRVNNSELRVNLHKTSGKVDEIYDKIKYLEQSDGDKNSKDFQVEVMKKLLSEYEHKIKAYEQIMASKNINGNIPFDSSNKEIETYKKEIAELESAIAIKDKENNKLSNNLQNALRELAELKQAHELNCSKLETAHEQLKDKDETTVDVDTFKNGVRDVLSFIKTSFENDKSYLGQVVKHEVANYLKQIMLSVATGEYIDKE